MGEFNPTAQEIMAVLWDALPHDAQPPEFARVPMQEIFREEYEKQAEAILTLFTPMRQAAGGMEIEIADLRAKLEQLREGFKDCGHSRPGDFVKLLLCHACADQLAQAEARARNARAEIVKRWRFKSAAGDYRCDDCCHAWPDENGAPLTCTEEPSSLCREGHECNIRPVLAALNPPCLPDGKTHP